ncbi:MAG: AtpZ/AtpI family protein [Antricoccus sp.]
MIVEPRPDQSGQDAASSAVEASADSVEDDEKKVARKAAQKAARVERKRDALDGSDQGWAATETMLSGILAWGLIGWGLKAWTGWIGFLPICVLLGAGLGIYLVIKRAGGLTGPQAIAPSNRAAQSTQNDEPT